MCVLDEVPPSCESMFLLCRREPRIDVRSFRMTRAVRNMSMRCSWQAKRTARDSADPS